MIEYIDVNQPHPGVSVVAMTNQAIGNFCSWGAVNQLAEALSEVG